MTAIAQRSPADVIRWTVVVAPPSGGGWCGRRFGLVVSVGLLVTNSTPAPTEPSPPCSRLPAAGPIDLDSDVGGARFVYSGVTRAGGVHRFGARSPRWESGL